MAVRRIKCRAHGGIFTIQVKRGRQPVSCKPEFPCDRADTPEYKVGDTVTVGGIAFTKHAELPESFAEAPKPANPSLPLAKAAKERLTAVGWVVHGRGFADDDGRWCAEVTASRDQETLIMQWLDGVCVRQDYSMEFAKPSQNNYPENDLHFDPAELSDSELVRMIKGMKVTWWNTIAGGKETAVIGGNVTIEHIFFANGDEDSSKRIVKFIDHGGGGFRAFHVSALLKVG